MALLDGDRFEGRFRDGTHVADVSDLMRRMVKESLLKFDATPLFPERIAYTVPYKLSPPEAQLYKAVTEYVREEFNRAEALQNDNGPGRWASHSRFCSVAWHRRPCTPLISDVAHPRALPPRNADCRVDLNLRIRQGRRLAFSIREESCQPEHASSEDTDGCSQGLLKKLRLRGSRFLLPYAERNRFGSVSQLGQRERWGLGGQYSIERDDC
jgi:hypothetical protein